MAALVLALGVVTLVFGERIGINAGQGWDGLSYMRWSDQFWHRVVELGVTDYQAQRVLPSLIVYAIAHPLGIAPTVPNHVLMFALLDLFMLVASAVIWAHLALRVLRWRACVAWVGFVALFGCFANARHALYDPVLVDSTAFALGMLMTWGFVARRTWAVVASAVLGVVTWPPLPVIACLMLMFPRAREPVAPVRGGRAIAAAVAVALVAWIFWSTFDYRASPLAGVGDDKLIAWIRDDLLAITVPLVALQLALGFYLVARDGRLWNVIAHARRVRVLAVAGVIALFFARMWWLHKAGTAEGGPTRQQFFGEFGLELLRGPLWGLVHHVVYFGPIVIVAVLAWPRACAICAEWGPGAAAAAGMLVGFAAASESRQWIHLFPFLVVLALAASAERWTTRRAVGFAVLALAWSKLWLHIGFNYIAGWHAQPDQRYFMHIGPYASDRMYVIHGIAAVVTAIVLTSVWRRASKQHDETA
jgi:hypothetical protein